MTQEQTNADNCDLLELMKLLAIQPFNLNKYREYGRVHGFNGFYGRELSWNQIIHMTDKNFTTRGTFEENKKIADAKSLDEKMTKQIKVDVDRSLNSIDEFENWTQSEIEDFRTDLFDVLITIFTLNPNYNYYQGFHDVATVFLYQLGKEAGFQALMHMCHAFHRDALSFPFEKSVTQQLRLVFKVLRAYDPAHADLLDELYEGVPMFAIPWLLTWFAHSIKSLDDILRIYDFLLSSPPQTIIYMCAALLITTKEELLKSASEIDMPACHMFYQRLEIEDVELLIATTIEIELNCDIGMQVLTLEGALIEESLLASFESMKYINKDYTHADQKEALELLDKAKRNEREWTSKVAVKFSLAGLAIAGAFAAFKSGERSSLIDV